MLYMMETYSAFLKPALNLSDGEKAFLLREFEEKIFPLNAKPLGFHEYQLELEDGKADLMQIWADLKSLTDGRAIFAMCRHSTDGVTIASGNESFSISFEKRIQTRTGTKLELLREAFRGM